MCNMESMSWLHGVVIGDGNGSHIARGWHCSGSGSSSGEDVAGCRSRSAHATRLGSG